jgi:glutathione S-transferase
MYVLYHCVNARSFRPLWALEELELSYELKLLPFPPRALAKSYLEINPLGTIPLFVDGDTMMTESSAICEYLATKHAPTPLAVTAAEPEFGAWLNAIHFGEATLTFPQTLVLRYSRLEPKERRNPQVSEDYARWFNGRLRAVARKVEEAPYLCAGRFTMADISVGYALMLARSLGLDTEFTPAVRSYWERISSRDGFKRAQGAQEDAAKKAGLADSIPRGGH